MNERKKETILYIDDEKNNLESLKATFRKEYNILTAESAEQALAILSEHEIAVVLVQSTHAGHDRSTTAGSYWP